MFSLCLLKVLKQLNLPLQLSLSDEDVIKAKKPWELIPAGHRIGTPEPLFTELVYTVLNCSLLMITYGLLRITMHYLCNVQKNEQVEFFREKYAGNQADRADRAARAEAE